MPTVTEEKPNIGNTTVRTSVIQVSDHVSSHVFKEG